MPDPVRCLPLGEGAVTLTLADEISLETHQHVHAIAEALTRDPPPGLRDIVAAYTTLSVFFDPGLLAFETVRDRLLGLRETVGVESIPPGQEWVIPVRYDGPDLAEVASRTGLSPEEVITRHTGRSYRVYLIGFVPGFAFLGELDPRLVLPRRESPRQRVPAGAVAIAGAQTGVYPLETPGGWHLIGHTDTRPFDLARDPAVLFKVGDRVRFEAIR
jgi:KipI family sensor histidine kinase inhibitor